MDSGHIAQPQLHSNLNIDNTASGFLISFPPVRIFSRKLKRKLCSFIPATKSRPDLKLAQYKYVKLNKPSVFLLNKLPVRWLILVCFS